MSTERYLGVKDPFCAIVTEDTEGKYIADTPFRIGRAVKIQMDTKVEELILYSDSMQEDVLYNLQNIQVTLETDFITPENQAKMLGKTLTDNGILIEKKDDEAPQCAFMFRVKRKNGKYCFIVLFSGKWSNDTSEKFQSDDKSPQTVTSEIKGEFQPRMVDSAFRMKIYEDYLTDTSLTAKQIISKFFSEVPMQVMGPIVTTTPSTISIAVAGTSQITTTAPLTGIAYSSSDLTIATVDNTGKVTGIKAGTATITLKADKYTDKTVVVTVTAS